ncbi:ATP-binding protein [Desulfosporosinus sp. PR]|uniref:sensor histidine kinase n=1 Tax=Candidatus Desulfosporosinus nitrosoreducens TaxID=3401928 RepID=UPI0027EA3CC1|nr:ATP-binding protein [Desulfosporosinus sp. PR]MDQ7097033.1 ATP-binding protein [Desulfosporosinus sp. PR]
MRLKFDHKSIVYKMWLYFFLFAILILSVLWLLQIVLLKNYYQGMKTREILSMANALKSKYGQTDFDNTIQQYSYNNNLIIMVTDTAGNIELSTDSFGGGPPAQQSMGLNRILPANNYEQLRDQLLKSGKSELYFNVQNTRLKGLMLEYGALLTDTTGKKAILYIIAPLDPIDSTIAVLKNQLIYVSIIILLIAFFIALFISRRFSKPIEMLTSSAKELAKGNYDIVFVKGSYSEIDQLASTLNYATRELSQTENLRKDLIANVSHDLRTPLTMIKAYAEMLRDISWKDEHKREIHANVIIEEADRLSGLVNDMLDLSKIQSGTEKIVFNTFNISQTVSSILKRFHILVERDGYEFICSCADNAVVNADEKRIEQVIYNLISNAVNYTGNNKQIKISLEISDDQVRFAVTDTGKGIPKDKLETIWERYYKASETHKRPVIGTGLGLSIVKNILEAHQANYGVDSTINQGSTFWFELKK